MLIHYQAQVKCVKAYEENIALEPDLGYVLITANFALAMLNAPPKVLVHIHIRNFKYTMNENI